jgi:hypothetical protein
MNVTQVLQSVPEESRGVLAISMVKMFVGAIDEINAFIPKMNEPVVAPIVIKGIPKADALHVLKLLRHDVEASVNRKEGDDSHLCCNLELYEDDRTITRTVEEATKRAIRVWIDSMIPKELVNRPWCRDFVNSYGLNAAIALSQPQVREFLITVTQAAEKKGQSLFTHLNLDKHDSLIRWANIATAIAAYDAGVPVKVKMEQVSRFANGTLNVDKLPQATIKKLIAKHAGRSSWDAGSLASHYCNTIRLQALNESISALEQA